MFGDILKARNSSFQRGMTFGRSIYEKKVMKLLAFIFEQPSYLYFTLILDMGKLVLWQTVKTQIKYHVLGHFIRVCTTC